MQIFQALFNNEFRAVISSLNCIFLFAFIRNKIKLNNQPEYLT